MHMTIRAGTALSSNKTVVEGIDHEGDRGSCECGRDSGNGRGHRGRQVVLVAAKRQAIWLHPLGRTGEVQDVGENFENDHHRH
jgi:hypothetical protein